MIVVPNPIKPFVLYESLVDLLFAMKFAPVFLNNYQILEIEKYQ